MFFKRGYLRNRQRFFLYTLIQHRKKNIKMFNTSVFRTRHFLARQEQRLWKTNVPFFNFCTMILEVLNVHFRRSFFVIPARERDKEKTNIRHQYVISTGCTLNTSQKVRTGFYARVLDVSEIEQIRFLLKCSSLKVQLRLTCCVFFPFLLLFRKLSTIFLSDNDINGVILCHSSFRTVARFSTRRTLPYGFNKLPALQVPINGGKLGVKLKQRCGF